MNRKREKLSAQTNSARVIIPLGYPDLDYPNDQYELLLKEIQSFGDMSNLVLLIDYEDEFSYIEKIKFGIREIGKPGISEIKKLKRIHPDFYTNFINEFLIIEIESKQSYNLSVININNLLRKLSLIVHLAYATSVKFLHGLVYINDEEFIGTTDIVGNTLDFAYEHACKTNWPTLEGITITQTLHWFMEYQIRLDGVSKSKSQRAINAFSYLFDNIVENDKAKLFWCMLGIETLLATGTESISNQIRLKSAIILGVPNAYNKKINKLYAYRSRLVHGDLDFPAKFSSDYKVFEEEYWVYLSFASSIHLALIRKLIVSKKSEFSFSYLLN